MPRQSIFKLIRLVGPYDVAKAMPGFETLEQAKMENQKRGASLYRYAVSQLSPRSPRSPRSPPVYDTHRITNAAGPHCISSNAGAT